MKSLSIAIHELQSVNPHWKHLKDLSNDLKMDYSSLKRYASGKRYPDKKNEDKLMKLFTEHHISFYKHSALNMTSFSDDINGINGSTIKDAKVFVSVKEGNGKRIEMNNKNDPFESLLKPHKTIRDAVHGDIMITALEASILDTKELQRLHKIKQLGPTNLVYPCANHTRFDHSLGCLYMTQHLLSLVLKNPYKDPNIIITNREIVIARISALLHDLVHVPYGHTLEDEGNLMPSQWHDDDRVTFFIGEKSVIANRIIDNVNATGQDGLSVWKEIEMILTANKSSINNLPHPYIYDIINNTICADLLDYLKRDIYFCGLKEDYDPRFLSYFYLTNYNGKPRMILRLVKPSTKRVRRDVLSETLHLLRLRYSLAEKVYYHHAKVSASAMIIAAVNASLISKNIDISDLYGIGDDELTNLLKMEGAPVTKYIIEKLENRTLYKPVYNLTYSESGFGKRSAEQKRSLIQSLTNPLNRFQKERELEIKNFLDNESAGSVIIYCPGQDMGQKLVKTLVEWSENKGPLDEITDDDIKIEIKSSITDKHLSLWNMYVFVDPTIPNDAKCNIAGDCIADFQIANEIENENYCHVVPDYLTRFGELYSQEEKELSHIDYEEVRKIRAEEIGTRGSEHKVLSYDEFKKFIKDLRK